MRIMSQGFSILFLPQEQVAKQLINKSLSYRLVAMASPQPPPGPIGNGNDGNGPADKQQSTNSSSAQTQPVLEILGGDAYAAVVVCALLLMNLTQGIVIAEAFHFFTSTTKGRVLYIWDMPQSQDCL